MKWSWKLADIAGIGVYMHATFLLLIVWVVLIHWSQGQTLIATLEGILFILLLFGCVVLHEFGHALTARRYGIRTRDITLLPIGGVARLERMPRDPIQELWVALAGPAVNIVIAIVLAFGLMLAGAVGLSGGITITSGPLVERLLILNVVLAVFNMLPAFPMDGGRVLRALLATRWEYTRATHLAANVGQGMAFLFGLIGLFYNPFLIFIALFVWIGAAQEESMVQIKSALSGIPVNRAMITDFQVLAPGDRLSHAVELTLTGSQKDFPVMEGSQVVGILRQEDLLAALAREQRSETVDQFMQKHFQVADPLEMLETVFSRLQNCDCRTLPVLAGEDLLGLVTMDNLGEFLRIQAALRTPKSFASPRGS